MGTLNDTIRYGIHYYPMLLGSRIARLDHLYCVLGGGYDWVRGELVSWSASQPTEAPEERLIEWLGSPDMAGLDPAYIERIHGERMREIRYAHDNEDALVLGQLDYTLTGWRGFYPFGEDRTLANLCCVPDDVKPDWLAGAVEVAELVIAYGELEAPPGEHEESFASAESRRANAETATLVLRSLRRRFPGCSAPPGLGRAGLQIARRAATE